MCCWHSVSIDVTITVVLKCKQIYICKSIKSSSLDCQEPLKFHRMIRKQNIFLWVAGLVGQKLRTNAQRVKKTKINRSRAIQVFTVWFDDVVVVYLKIMSFIFLMIKGENNRENQNIADSQQHNGNTRFIFGWRKTSKIRCIKSSNKNILIPQKKHLVKGDW